MPAVELGGEGLARALLAPCAGAARARLARAPALAAVRATDDPGAGWYARAQARHCALHGVGHMDRYGGAGPGATEDEILAAVRRANRDPAVDGLIVLRPLPAGVRAGAVAEAIDPAKDVEGLHPANLGRLLLEGADWDRLEDGASAADPRGHYAMPCTALAAAWLARSVWPSLAGRRALVVGRSAIVGKPLSLLLTGLDATVTLGHTRSPGLPALAREADLLVAAAGASGAAWSRHLREAGRRREAGLPPPPPPDLAPLVKGDWVKEGAMVIDVGENSVPARRDAQGGPVPEPDGTYRMEHAGDVDRDGAAARAGWISAARGGVGALTNAFLLRNLLLNALRAAAVR